jgi:serine/threonine protein kinase
MLVMKYANGGDLRHYLSNNNSMLTWGQKLLMLKDIALGLEEIHSMKLIHRDFHSGNILQSISKSDGTSKTFVTDLGLCRPVNQTLKNISEKRDVYGVMPYIAPEILRRTHDYNESSDIYSFGIIMWEILHEKSPFNNIPHNVNLAIKICEGLRPRIEKRRVPKWYIDLMIRCWNKDPLKRPDILEVRKTIANKYLNEKHGTMNLPYKVRKVKRLSQITSHPEAVFTSRLLNYSNLPQPLDAPDISGKKSETLSFIFYFLLTFLFLLILYKEANNIESSHTYSEFKSKFADFEIGLSHADSESGLRRRKLLQKNLISLILSSSP